MTEAVKGNFIDPKTGAELPDRRKDSNASLRAFLAFLEKTRFYGKLTITFKNGEPVGPLETNSTHRLEDFPG